MKNVKSKWPFLKIKVGFCPKILGVKSKKWSKKVNVKSKWPKKVGFCPFLKMDLAN